ncbi:hypothetical protein E2F50_00170 [Rhizobium deserti]|uniref:Lipoprotein n=1 Tax=Rhizobium deserti TaxID=2547961 RepID=A0A4R5ULB9_9HYPH|nr:hypothetical protein E2F50_00170 [Rhizobium deserti]
MSKRTIRVATAIGFACLTLTGCVSESGTYTSYNRVYDRSDRSDTYWNRRNRDRDRHRDREHHGRPDRDRGRPDRDHGSPDRDNGRPDRPSDSGRFNSSSWGRDRHDGSRDVIIPNQ